MSRHRLVRDLAKQGYEDEYDGYSEDEYYDHADDDKTTDNSKCIDDQIEQVTSILDELKLSRKSITESLYYYNCDVEKTVDYLIKKHQPKKELKLEAQPKVDVPIEKKTQLKVNVIPIEKKASIKTLQSTSSNKQKQKSLQTCDNNKDHINLVVVGHVDAGKSTTMGHLLYLCGQVTEKTIRKYQKDSQALGKQSFAFAWVLDQTTEERDRGVTVDIAISNFETRLKRVTLLDAPGHRDFVPNMISGASQADSAILVVDARPNEFESGFLNKGQSKEHTILVRSLGVQQLIVAVNKMDDVAWKQERYQAIKETLTLFLKSVGFQEKNLKFVPISGLKGENLTEKTKLSQASWYNGPTLLAAIDELAPPIRLIDKPWRLSISDIFKGGPGVQGVCVAGKVLAGTISIGEKVLVLPGDGSATIKSISVNEIPLNSASCGENIIASLTGIENDLLSVGKVICPVANPIPVKTAFQARIVVFDLKIPITPGFSVIFHRQSLSELATIYQLVALMDKTSGEVTKKKPRILTSGITAVVNIKLDKPTCLELYNELKDLGRFMLRFNGETIAAGVVVELL